MEKALIAGMVGVVLLGLGFSTALGNRGVKSDEPAMMASPQTIVLGKVDAVTVHTNIPAARFAAADLDLPAGEVTLTLYGSYTAGGTFAVEDVLNVK